MTYSGDRFPSRADMGLGLFAVCWIVAVLAVVELVLAHQPRILQDIAYPLAAGDTASPCDPVDLVFEHDDGERTLELCTAP